MDDGDKQSKEDTPDPHCKEEASATISTPPSSTTSFGPAYRSLMVAHARGKNAGSLGSTPDAASSHGHNSTKRA
jgi:hypothetical protein